jgi:hypothetical protein
MVVFWGMFHSNPRSFMKSKHPSGPLRVIIPHEPIP